MSNIDNNYLEKKKNHMDYSDLNFNALVFKEETIQTMDEKMIPNYGTSQSFSQTLHNTRIPTLPTFIWAIRNEQDQ